VFGTWRNHVVALVPASLASQPGTALCTPATTSSKLVADPARHGDGCLVRTEPSSGPGALTGRSDSASPAQTPAPCGRGRDSRRGRNQSQL